jgi:FKBP-type peptidyl-prolyl cis-trans isomerase
MVPYSVGIGTKAGSITTTRGNSVAAVAGSLRAAAAAIQADPSMITTTSGLTYKELVRGSGIAVGTNTKFTAKYSGYNSDGDLFDSGTLTDKAISGMISGFSEGLKTMTVDSTSQFIIPANLAYGNDPPSNGKPIVFIVELLAFAP